MKNLLKALLFAGLFYSLGIMAAQIGGTDYAAGSYGPSKADKTVCFGWHPTMSNTEDDFPKFYLNGKVTGWDCSVEASKRYRQDYMDWINVGAQCPAYVKTISETGWEYQRQYLFTNQSTGESFCADYSSPVGASINSAVKEYVLDLVCPPEFTGNAAEDAIRQQFTILGQAPGTQTQACFKPLAPLDCSALNGIATTGTDSFITTTAGYEHPSCVTKCASFPNGNTQCGNCKVIAKSWIQNTLGGDMKKWQPLVGTFTGASCADNEQEVEPPEQPKCWQTKNNLKMCQQDPAEKCVTINGVQQCEAGCGYINGDFFCQDNTGDVPPKRNDDDKPLPDPIDEISDPNKALPDMVKQDFKDVNIGVESRLDIVGTGVGNLENSVDTSNQLLEQIVQNTQGARADNQTQIGLLDDIKDILSGDGACDPETDPDCGLECDPNKDPTCQDGGDAGSPASWWTSVYPDGITGIIDNKKAQFQNSGAFNAMTQDIDIGGGTLQPWQLCFNSSSMNFGCFEIEIPAYVLQFVRLCILFGAAILCRRLLIGA